MDTMDQPDKTIPANPEAEEAVLGSLLIDPDAVIKVASFLRADDFYREKSGWLYQAILDLHERREPADFVTLLDELERRDQLQEVGGPAYITSLINSVPTAVHVEHYARIVERAATLRRLIAAAGQIAALAYREADDVDEVVDRAEQLIFNVSERRVRRDLAPVRQIMHDVVDRIEFLHRHKGDILGVPSGFTKLDRLLGGFQKSDLIVLAARPGVGKTSMALNFALNAAKRYGQRVAFFSLEMSAEQLVQRLLASETGINQQKLRLGEINEDEWQMLMEAAGVLSDTLLFIDDTPAMSALELRTKARRLQAEHGLDLVIVDYLQLMRGDARVENRVQEISYITRSLKSLAREIEVPLIALSQLSRAVEARSDHKPILSDLRESGCLTGDTLVLLADTGARVPIKSLVGQDGFRVWALDQETWQLQSALVSKAWTTGIKPVYRLETRLGRFVRATANHKFRTLSGWLRLDELQVGDRIALPRRIASPQMGELTSEQAALLAHLIGDGCTLPRHAIQYTTNAPDLAAQVSDLARQVFGAQVQPHIRQERQWLQVYLAASQHLTHGVRNPIAEWLDSLGVFGLRAPEKHVPDAVFRSTEATLSAFLRHLWATDGCIHTSANGSDHAPTIYYATSSERLARDVQSLLLRLGIDASLRCQSQGTKGRPQFHVLIMGRLDSLAYADRVGAVGVRQSTALAACMAWYRERAADTNRDVIPAAVWRQMVVPIMREKAITSRQLQKAIGMSYMGTSLYQQNVSRERLSRVAAALEDHPDLTALARSDVYWDMVTAIESAGEEEVYDLTVPGHHNFIANDIIVHNSIEQDADIVMFIYREDMVKENTERKNIADVIVAKHRNGPTDTVPLYFDKALTRFADLELTKEPLDYAG
jgi:replicative DNA helicase